MESAAAIDYTKKILDKLSFSLLVDDNEKQEVAYKELSETYLKCEMWGLSSIIDLKSCHEGLIRHPAAILGFIVELCELIQMKRFGEPTIVRFGDDPKVQGYSFVQLIETSVISGHIAEQTNNVYIDIFSCKLYSPWQAAQFARDYFSAKHFYASFNFR